MGIRRGDPDHGNPEAGETYLLAEVLPATGYAWAEEIPFTVGGDGGIHRVRMEDRPTQAEIRKTDMVTGEELPGAVLVLKDKNGRVVDRWTSGNTPHRIMGRLNAGEAYTLSEVTAPSGYQIAEEVTFTVSEDGTIDRVVMEDKRKEPEKPENQGNRKNRNGRYRMMTEKRNRKRRMRQRLRKLSRRRSPGKKES